MSAQKSLKSSDRFFEIMSEIRSESTRFLIMDDAVAQGFEWNRIIFIACEKGLSPI